MDGGSFCGEGVQRVWVRIRWGREKSWQNVLPRMVEGWFCGGEGYCLGGGQVAAGVRRELSRRSCSGHGGDRTACEHLINATHTHQTRPPDQGFPRRRAVLRRTQLKAPPSHTHTLPMQGAATRALPPSLPHRRAVRRIQLLPQRQQAVGGGSANHARAQACTEAVGDGGCSGMGKRKQRWRWRCPPRPHTSQFGSGERGYTLGVVFKGRAHNVPYQTDNTPSTADLYSNQTQQTAQPRKWSMASDSPSPMKANTAPLYAKLTAREARLKPGWNMWPGGACHALR